MFICSFGYFGASGIILHTSSRNRNDWNLASPREEGTRNMQHQEYTQEGKPSAGWLVVSTSVGVSLHHHTHWPHFESVMRSNENPKCLHKSIMRCNENLKSLRNEAYELYCWTLRIETLLRENQPQKWGLQRRSLGMRGAATKCCTWVQFTITVYWVGLPVLSPIVSLNKIFSILFACSHTCGAYAKPMPPGINNVVHSWFTIYATTWK